MELVRCTRAEQLEDRRAVGGRSSTRTPWIIKHADMAGMVLAWDKDVMAATQAASRLGHQPVSRQATRAFFPQLAVRAGGESAGTTRPLAPS